MRTDNSRCRALHAGRLVTACLLFLGAPQIAWTDCGKDWVDRAIAANNDGRFEDMAAISTEAIEADLPSCDLYTAYAFRGKARINIGQEAEGVIDIEQAISIDPDKCYGHLLLHVARFTKRERPLPTDGLKRCLSNDPFDQTAISFIGGAHYANGEYADAARAYQSLYLLTGNRVDRLMHISMTRQAGMLEKAEVLIREAVAEAPEHWGGYEELSQLLRSQGKFEEADRTLQAAIDKLPESEPDAEAFLADMLSTRAKLYFEMDQPEKARAAAERALSVSQVAEPYLILARISFAEGASSRACEQIARAATLDVHYALIDDFEALATKCAE